MKEILKKLTKKNASKIVKASAIAGLLFAATGANTGNANLLHNNELTSQGRNLDTKLVTQDTATNFLAKLKSKKNTQKINITTNVISDRVANMSEESKRAFNNAFKKLSTVILKKAFLNKVTPEYAKQKKAQDTLTKQKELAELVDKWEGFFQTYKEGKISSKELKEIVQFSITEAKNNKNTENADILTEILSNKNTAEEFPNLFQNDSRYDNATRAKRQEFKKIVTELSGGSIRVAELSDWLVNQTTFKIENNKFNTTAKKKGV